MATQTTTPFDVRRLTRAVQERDAETQLEMYAPDATVKVVDRITQPGSPRILRGHAEIGSWIADTASRDMVHTVEHAVQDAGGAAFALSCRYPDGTNVLCATVLELVDGLIVRQIVAQAWDEK